MKKMTKEHYTNVCKIGQGKQCCRYLVAGPTGLECARLTSLKKLIDQRVSQGHYKAQGQNCYGLNPVNQSELRTWMEPGDIVTYLPKMEHGRVKRVTEDGAFVVYNCNKEWDNYLDYTAAKTNFRDLKLGWHE